MLNRDDIIIKYLAGEISPIEKKELTEWLAETPENQAQMDTWKRIWKDSEMEVDKFSPDVGAAWSKVSQSMDQMSSIREAVLEPQIKQVSLTNFILRIAAILLIGSTIVWTAYEISQEAQPGIAWIAKITGQGQRSEIQLADGSTIYLNKNSQLDYPESFRDDVREVRLKGEAYFEIAPNPEKPFIITTANTRTQVVGTSFNIKARPDEDHVTVSVISGQVLFSEQTNEGNEVSLTKGFRGIYSGAGQDLRREEYYNPNFMAWQTGILEFDQTPLAEAAETLSEYYGQSFILQGDNFGRCRITSTFDNQPLLEVLEIIELVLEAKVDNQGDQIIITGSGCRN